MRKILWQLRNKKTGENLSEPQPLPENWGPIYGMHAFKDRLGDLSWINRPDLAWVEIGLEPEIIIDKKEVIKDQINHIINETNKYVVSDNTKISVQEKNNWLEYRKLIRKIPEQIGFPDEVFWPKRPDS